MQSFPAITSKLESATKAGGQFQRYEFMTMYLGISYGINLKEESEINTISDSS